MDKIQKQILENQSDIMEALKITDRDSFKNTLNLLYPTKEEKEPCCEMPEDANARIDVLQKEEVKKDE